tara:strand:+ start:2689 stop:2949 length:261 start_codon:yes stop_codon:yes gene_type:complete
MSSEGSEKPQVLTNLTVNDLAVIKQIIDIATRRGAFIASELTTVGVIYDRIDECLSQFTQEEPSDTSNQEQTFNGDLPITSNINLS